jgi:HEAT repeat protein
VTEVADVPLRTSVVRCLTVLAPERARAAHATLVPDIVADALLAATTAPAVLGAAAEPGLLALLAHPDGDVRRAAAEALGIVGTVAAVGPLHRVGDERLGLTAAALAARHAITQIPARAERAEVGQLSLAADAPMLGAVAVATGDVGAVGLAEAVRAPPVKGEDAAGAAQPRPVPQGIRG